MKENLKFEAFGILHGLEALPVFILRVRDLCPIEFVSPRAPSSGERLSRQCPREAAHLLPS